MEYAIIKTGGKQYKVSKDSIIEVERLDVKPGENLTFEDVLLHVKDGTSKIGKPKVAGANVKATVLEHLREEKIRVAKFKAKVRYRRVTGHRQEHTRLKIDEIKKS